jgi:hypothetical protein
MRWNVPLALALLSLVSTGWAVEHSVFDHLLTFTPPTGEEKEEVRDLGRNLTYEQRSDHPYRLLTWNINEFRRPDPRTPAEHLRSELDVVDANRRMGNDVTPLGAATIGTTCSLVVTSDHYGDPGDTDAQRQWYADCVVDGRYLGIQVTLVGDGPELPAKEIAEADAAIEAFLASFATRTGERPFGATAVHDALAVRPPPPAPMGRPPNPAGNGEKQKAPAGRAEQPER